MEHERVVVVVSGGGPPDDAATAGLPQDAYVIAADSGLDHAERLGLAVDMVVGDMDSVSQAALDRAAAAGARVEQHPDAKDETDLELALDRAVGRRPDHVVVLGSDAGRLDHLLATALLLASDRYAAVPIEARLGRARVAVVRGEGEIELHGAPGDLVSLLPVHGPASGVTTHGLLYPLQNEPLAAGSPRGVSNVFVTSSARVEVRYGLLLAIQPGPES